MPEARDPLDVAVQALRHRDRSARDVEDRLARAGVDEERRAEALETLSRLGYVDDDRFATGRAAALAERGYGDAWIRLDLEQQGVVGEAVDAAVALLESERERAVRVVSQLGASPKTARRLAAKGFSEESVGEALGGDVAALDPRDV